MTPYAGESVNVGMDDARKLAAAIIRAVQGGRKKREEEGEGEGEGDESKDKTTSALEGRSEPKDDDGAALDDAVRASEAEMFARMQSYMRLTKTMMELWMFSPDINAAVPGIVYEHVRMDTPRLLHPVLWIAIQTWWYVARVIKVLRRVPA
jgi:hypothetical protein